ncbi:hypothetical protein HD806DRAFT_516730 [Xylariaceae sp. AK1471]|nr:hypothetical protein HD806DRAFT_516730 [Xylariaceae sp. AK1471]
MLNQGQSAVRRQWHTPVRNRFSAAYILALTRRLNRKLVIVAAIVGLSIVSVLSFANPYSLFRSGLLSDATADTLSKLKETLLPPTYCTTWPVDEDGSYNTTSISEHPKLVLDTLAPPGGWRKPAGIRVVAMIFYGRRRTVDILDCYLQQNLVTNGGYLDEVWFMIHTKVKEDLHWLHEKVAHEQAYKFKDFRDTCNDYGCLWDYATEDDTIYVKIDDDMTYIHHDAIPQLVHTRIAEPHPYAISAQIVNSPVMGLASYHFGAIHPFLPDPHQNNRRESAETWRVSELPSYPLTSQTQDGSIYVDAPYRGHPWLLITSSSGMSPSSAMTRTPIAQWNANQGSAAIAWGPGWKSWGVAAQQEYSLLWNLENNEMDRYHFGRAIDYDGKRNSSHSDETGGPGGEQLYDMQYRRYNLNFVAIWGRDVKAGLPIKNDEAELTQLIPERLGRPFVVDTRAVVAHHSFYTQKGGILATDLLDRWRAFANENVCAADNQKKPWDLRCDGF